MGHASEVSIRDLVDEFSPFLVEGEELLLAYKLVRDVFVFTDRRLILVDRQGLSGRKVDYQSIPYKSIVRFSKESAGMFDLDAELKIWVRGTERPIEKEFRQDKSINDIYRALSEAVLGT
jgi:hypothetical protein